MTSSYDIRILLIEQNTPTTKRLFTYLKESGFNVQAVYDGLQAPNKIMEVRPHFILMDLAMPDFSAFDCLDFLNSKNLLEDGQMRLFVMSSHNAKQNVDLCLKKGANDYLVKPINPMDILTRIALHLQANKQLKKVEEIENDSSKQANYYLNLVELLIKTAAVRTTPHQINYQMLRMLAMPLKAVRISLINLEPMPMVVASSDNPGFSQFELQLEKYPEIDYVQRTQKPLMIENVTDHGQLAFIQKHLKTIHFNTMIVLPIIVGEQIKGILSARLQDSSNLTDADIRLCKVVTQIFCNYWQNQSQANPSKAS